MVSLAQVLKEKKKKAKTSFCRTSPATSASASTLWRRQSALRHNGGAEGEKEASRAQQGKFSRNLTEETDDIYCFGSTHYNISVSVLGVARCQLRRSFFFPSFFISLAVAPRERKPLIREFLSGGLASPRASVCRAPEAEMIWLQKSKSPTLMSLNIPEDTAGEYNCILS